MKKLFLMFLTLAMCVSLCACGGGKETTLTTEATTEAPTEVTELTDEELKSAYELIVGTKVILDYKYSPNGYNIGINEGRAAGRTIDHAHIHIIPRYDGDIDDPRGGVRGVIPDKRIY